MLRFLSFSIAATALALVGAAPSYAGVACINACENEGPEASCFSQGLGCNPFTHVCQPCVDNTWCAPGGLCQPDGTCIAVLCGGDGGVDAGPNAGVDAGPDTGVDGGPVTGDAGPDAGNDGGPADAEPVDTGMMGTATVADGGFVLDSGTPRIRPDAGKAVSDPPFVKDETFDEGCECTGAHARAGSPLAVLGLLFAGWVVRRRR